MVCTDTMGLAGGGIRLLALAMLVFPVTGWGSEKIGIVNVTRVFNSYKKVVKINEKIKELFLPKQKELETMEKEIKDLMEKIELDRGNPQRDRKKFDMIQLLEKKKFEFGEKGMELRKGIEDFRLAEMKQVLKDIRSSVKEVSEGQGFNMVLRAPDYGDELIPEVSDPEEMERLKPRTSGELVRMFRESPVLFFAQGVDVTERVIAKLNTDFEKEAAGKK